MFAKQYSHRLPAGHDMKALRERATQRGRLWDDTEDLIFKAFVTQERGRHGAVGNLYASVYLWREPAAAARFLMGERFQNVIDSFGRPRLETWLPLDARAGRAAPAQARWLLREEIDLDAAIDRAAWLAAERAEHAGIAAREDSVAVWSAIDLAQWRRTRFVLTTREPAESRAAAIYEVLHLSAPGHASLPQ